jgi:hypothetical protein
VLNGTLYLFGRGTNGNLYSRTTARHYDPRLGEYSYTWNAWERRTTGTDRKVWFKWYRSVWSNWIQQSTLGAVNSSVAATLYGGNTNLFARGPSGNVVWSPYAAGWQPWTSLGGVIL